MELAFIFGFIRVAKSASETVAWAADLPNLIKRLVGEVDSLDAKIDRLIKSDLNAGFSILDQAARADVEQESLLRDARSCFNRAFELEAGYRRGVSLLGL